MKKQQLLATPIVFLVSLLLASAHLLAAEDESPVPAMEALVTQEQCQQAFALGQENLNEWEGDPDFDYIFGLAALESGDANDSVFALERVAATATDPGLRALARLELARAYFVTNNLTAPEKFIQCGTGYQPTTECSAEYSILSPVDRSASECADTNAQLDSFSRHRLGQQCQQRHVERPD